MRGYFNDTSLIQFCSSQVLSEGRLVEFDHPHLLLEKKEGFFHQMADHTGPAESRRLKEIARGAYKRHSFNKWYYSHCVQ